MMFSPKKKPSAADLEMQSVNYATQQLEDCVNKILQLNHLKSKYIQGKANIISLAKEIKLEKQKPVDDDEAFIRASNTASVIIAKGRDAFNGWRINNDKKLDIACNTVYQQVSQLKDQISAYIPPVRAIEHAARNAIAINLLARIDDFEKLLGSVKDNIQHKLARIDSALEANNHHKDALSKQTGTDLKFK